MISTFARRQRGLSSLALMGGLVLVGALIGGVMVGTWVFLNVDARLLLNNQAARVTITDTLSVNARVLNDLDISLDEIIHTQVPIRKMVSVPVDETLNLVAKIKTKVPIDIQVRVQDVIPIDQILDIDAIVVAEVLGETVNIPIKGKVPVRADVPIDLIIPVKHNVAVDFTTPVQAVLKQNLSVPLDTIIDAEIPIRSEMSVPLHSALDAMIDFEGQAMEVVIEYADLKLPLRSLRLQLDDTEAPSREQ